MSQGSERADKLMTRLSGIGEAHYNRIYEVVSLLPDEQAAALIDAICGAIHEDVEAWAELAEAKSDLLACYRLGNRRQADKALARIERAEEAIRSRRLDARAREGRARS